MDNAPWFARSVAFGDRVRAEPDDDGVLWVQERLSWSGRYTVRVIPHGDEPAGEQLNAIIEAFSPLGAEYPGGLRRSRRSECLPQHWHNRRVIHLNACPIT